MGETEIVGKSTKRRVLIGQAFVVILILLLIWFIILQDLLIQLASLTMVIALITSFPVSITHRYYTTEEKSRQNEPILKMRFFSFWSKTIRHSILLVVIAILVAFGLTVTIFYLVSLNVTSTGLHLGFAFFAIYFVFELCKQTVYLTYRIIRPKQFDTDAS